MEAIKNVTKNIVEGKFDSGDYRDEAEHLAIAVINNLDDKLLSSGLDIVAAITRFANVKEAMEKDL